MFNLRRPDTPDEFTLGIKVDVERLRTEIILSQPAPGRSVVHRRDGYPRSIRGQRNPERCDGHPRSVRSQMNPEYCELSQRKRREFVLSKQVWMFSCTLTAEARTMGIPLFCFNQTSG